MEILNIYSLGHHDVFYKYFLKPQIMYGTDINTIIIILVFEKSKLIMNS